LTSIEFMKLDVCICTHNPPKQVFSLVLNALADQTLSKDAYQVWVIDNASSPAISIGDLAPLAAAGIGYHLIVEPRLGIMYARRRAIESTTGDLLLYVDDDNELAADYLERVMEIARERPEIGCFGGKLLLPDYLTPPQWLKPLLPYLAIKDLGDLEISQHLKKYAWAQGEPPTAGMTARRAVLERYLAKLANLPPELKLGRSGKQGLLSSEDSLLASGAYELNLACSYQPSLKLNHHINPRRFEFLYQVKLLFSYGRSNVLLQRAMNRELNEDVLHSLGTKLKWWWESDRDLRYLICQLAFEIGYVYQLRQDYPEPKPIDTQALAK
jgi:glycosyltransferase involved in cell wall biosynthesis